MFIWLLVVYLPLWKMMEFVSWDDDTPNLWKNNPHVPNHQPVKVLNMYLHIWCRSMMRWQIWQITTVTEELNSPSSRFQSLFARTLHLLWPEHHCRHRQHWQQVVPTTEPTCVCDVGCTSSDAHPVQLGRRTPGCRTCRQLVVEEPVAAAPQPGETCSLHGNEGRRMTQATWINWTTKITWKMLTWAGTSKCMTCSRLCSGDCASHLLTCTYNSRTTCFWHVSKRVNTCHVLFINKTLSNKFEFRHKLWYTKRKKE